MEKNIYKIYFIDLDGTLLDDRDEKGLAISERNIQAISTIQKLGSEVVISTGRFGLKINDFLKTINARYAVAANGALVFDYKGNVYKDDKLSIKQGLKLIDFAKRNKLSFKVDGEIEAYNSTTFLRGFLSSRMGFLPLTHSNIEMHKEYYKFVFWGKTKLGIKKLAKKLNLEIENLSIVTSSKGWTLEVTHINSTKGLGNLKVAQMLDIPSSDIVHIGDTMNDSTTAEYMDLIAMKDGDKNLQKVAKFIGPSHKKSGVARILNGEYIERATSSKK